MAHIDDSGITQPLFQELILHGLITRVLIQEAKPSKGKPLLRNLSSIWCIKISTSNGYESYLVSTRGTIREWASLDRMAEWLKTIGIVEFTVIQGGIK